MTDSPARLCPSCNRSLSSDARFCPSCGASVGTADAGGSTGLPGAKPATGPSAVKRISLGCVGILMVILLIGVISALTGGDRRSQQAAVGQTPSADQRSAATRAQATPTPSALPTAEQSTPTPIPDEHTLLARVDAAWAKGDWPSAIADLQLLRKIAPDSSSYRDKLYAAYIFYGQSLLKTGDKVSAGRQFENARDLDPNRGEAIAQLQALTPTATPAPGKASARYVDPRELTADPKSFVGQNIFLQGQTLTVDDRGTYSWVQVQARVRGRTIVEPVVVTFEPKEPKILSQECYRFYGVVAGTEKVTIILTGAANEVPLVRGYAWEPAPSGEYGIGCASP